MGLARFKAMPQLPWSRLDNAAKIFPPTSSARDTKVFRLACTLTQPVEPQPLAAALEATLEQFPFYRCALKKGLFWYYLENRRAPAQLAEEHTPPCAPLYRGDGRDPLYRVSYWRRRINLEVYHALADGTGAMRFLQLLVDEYLRRVHPESAEGAPLPAGEHASGAQRFDDSFARYYRPGQGVLPPRAPAAYHLRGQRWPGRRLSVIEGRMSASAVLEQAHRYGATMTVFLIAVLIQSIGAQMPLGARRRPVVVTVPVNLRSYFPSLTARNFFGVVEVGYNFSARSGAFEDIVAEVGRQLAEALCAERLSERMNRMAGLERMLLLRLVPLALKIPILRLFTLLSEREITVSFSNLGRITLPGWQRQWVEGFDVFLSTRRLQVCLVSYADALNISFTTPLVSADVQRGFFSRLAGMGIRVEAASNLGQLEGEGGAKDAVL